MPRPKPEPFTEDEWRQLPVLIDKHTVARVAGCTPRYVSDHAIEMGGTKVAGRWLFSKSRVGKLLGM